MEIALPLEKMTTLEKMAIIEKIWDDLSRNIDELPSPAWHEDVLRARERRVANGTARFLDIEQAKQAVRDQIK